jgi:hypothetical protein
LLFVASHPGNDPRRLADQAASDVDPRIVLREARDLASVVDLHRQVGDPGGHDPLDPVLEDPERVGVTGGEVAHVQQGVAERRGRMGLTLREEATGDAALIEHLDRAWMQAAGREPTSS